MRSHLLRLDIGEQAAAVTRALRNRLFTRSGAAVIDELRLSDSEMRNFDRVVLLGSGASHHATLIGQCLIDSLAGIGVEACHASAYAREAVGLDQRTLFIAVSESGETLPTIAALRDAGRRGATTVALVNAVNSTLAREAKHVVPIFAAVQRGATSTKAFTNQVVVLALVALALGRARGLDAARARAFSLTLRALPDMIEHALEGEQEVSLVAQQLADVRNLLFLGSHAHEAVALSGALLLRELSGTDGDGYRAAEIRQGARSRMEPFTPAVVVATHDAFLGQVMADLRAVRARRGMVTAIVNRRDTPLRRLVTHLLLVPETHVLLQPLINVVPLQLLAYHVAVIRGIDLGLVRHSAHQQEALVQAQY